MCDVDDSVAAFGLLITVWCRQQSGIGVTVVLFSNAGVLTTFYLPQGGGHVFGFVC